MGFAKDHLKNTLDRIDQAAKRSGRKPEEVTLLAVTKKVPLEKVLPFLEAGIHHVGENRVQEALTKYSTPSPLGGQGLGEGSNRPKFHLIGQLQTNKSKKAVGFFDVIQSLDRLELAEAINRHAQSLGKKQACLIEVKISSEETKTGLPPEQLSEFLHQVVSLPYLEIKGLMGIAPLGSSSEEARPHFRRLKKLFDLARSRVSSPSSYSIGRDSPLLGTSSALRVPGPETRNPKPETLFNVLSMGMSADFEVAIEEGSTMVRLGTALFGPR